MAPDANIRSEDIREIYNVLNSMREVVAVLKITTENLDHAINGNGRPGLLARMITIEERQSSCPARQNYTSAAQANRLSLYALLVAIISVAISFFMRK
jgi:hypothetical protein